MASKPTQGWAFFLFYFPVFFPCHTGKCLCCYRTLSWLAQEAALILLLPHEVEEMHWNETLPFEKTPSSCSNMSLANYRRRHLLLNIDAGEHIWISFQPSKVVCPKTQVVFQAEQRCILGARQQPSTRFLIMTASHLPLHYVLSFHLCHVL